MTSKLYAIPYRWIYLVFLLTACSTAPVQKEGVYSLAASQQLYDLKRWSLEGRLALSGGGDSWSADINWRHLPDTEEIKLSGPLGQGSVFIRLFEGFVTVDRGNGEVESSTDPEAFISQQLDLSVPVRSLRYWVAGVPMPDQPFEESAGGFKQADWQIDYQQMLAVSGQRMPRKITVKNTKVKLKLIIDQWNLF